MSPQQKKPKIQASSWPILLLCFIAGLVWAANLYINFNAISSSDAGLYAGTARNIVQGHGFLVPATLPVFLSSTIPPSLFGWPSYNNLLYPSIVAVFFYLFGANNFSIALTNGFFFVFTLPFLYLLAKKIFNHDRVAIIACLWYIFNPILLSYSVWGLPKMFFIFLITAGTFSLLAINNGYLLAGILFGLACLTKYQGILVLPALLLFLLWAKDYFPALLLLGGYGLTMVFKKLFLPPLVTDNVSFNHNNLWNAIAYNAFLPGQQIGRWLSPVSFSELFSHINLIITKLINNFYYFWQNLFAQSTSPVLFLYLLNFFKPAATKEAKRLKLLSLILVLAFLGFYLLTFFEPRYFHSFLPLIIILAAETFVTFIEKFRPKNFLFMSTLFTLFVIIIPCITSPTWGSSIRWRFAQKPKPSLDDFIAKIIKENTSPTAVVVSNAFSTVAWRGERRAILFPANLSELQKIDKEFVPIDFLFLVKSPLWPTFEPEWEELIENPHDFANFRFVKKTVIKPEENYHGMTAKIVLYTKKTGVKP